MRSISSRITVAVGWVWGAFAALLLSGCIPSGATSFQNSASPVPSPSQRTPGATPSTPPVALGERNFAKLMRMTPEARATPTPWAGYWWPDVEGGIAEAARLYENASGRTGAVAWERAHHGPASPGVLQWWGHCNGWAAAAALFPEPREPREISGVSFGIAEQKALLSEIAMEVDADFYGERDDSDDPSQLSFKDVFPDQFFLVLTNYLRTGSIVLMDRYTGSQVWNQAIAGYRNAPVTPEDVLAPDPAAPGITRVNMTTQIWWARDDVQPDFLTAPFHFEDSDSFQSRVLSYELWLDGPVKFDGGGNILSSGNVVLAMKQNTVIGGVWKNGELDPMNSHPDYLWVAHALSPSTGFANAQIDPAWVTRAFGTGSLLRN